MKPTIIIERLREDSLAAQMAGACDRIGLAERLANPGTVFIKPNLTYPVFKEGVTTRGIFVEALVSVIRGINPKTAILIGEGEGGYNSFSMSAAFESMGFRELERRFSGVRIVNLSEMPSRAVDIDTDKGPYRVSLPEIFFREIDFSISCPVPKVHCMTGLTLSYKNQWGCLPDVMRLKNHYMFDRIISRVSDLLKFNYAFLDGKFGLDRNGPMVGDPVEVNWFAASNSLGAFDRVIAGMMGFDWRKIGHLRAADRYGYVPGADDLEVIGDPGALKRKFELRRSLWNYPALAGFHSKQLTHLFYFSSCAGLLHRIMYTFRKKPISP